MGNKAKAFKLTDHGKLTNLPNHGITFSVFTHTATSSSLGNKYEALQWALYELENKGFDYQDLHDRIVATLTKDELAEWQKYRQFITIDDNEESYYVSVDVC